MTASGADLVTSAWALPAGAPAPGPVVVFRGVPAVVDGEAVLFDSSEPGSAAVLPDRFTFGRLVLRFPQGGPEPNDVDPGLAVWIFVDDPAAPRARVRLADLVRQGGERPLKLHKGTGQAVRVVRVDPVGAWAEGGLEIELALGA